MTQVRPEGYGQVIHSLTWAGDPEPMAVTYAVAPITVDPFTVQEMADVCAQAFVDNILLELSSLISLTETVVTFQEDAPPDPPVLAVSTITGVGGDSGNVIPQNSAYLVHKRSPVAGRGGRGRLYLPGVIEANVDNLGNVAGAKVTALNTKLAAFLTDIEGAGPPGFGMYLLHDDAASTAADLPAPVTVMTADTRIATQRRRLRK